MELKKKAGRSTDYTIEIAHEICEVVSTTSKGIKVLCKENEHWPSHKTLYLWLMNHKEFSDLYARAKRQQVEVIVDEILAIADDSASDSYINEEGKLVVDHEHINRARLRVDTRKWIAAKLVPRLYGAISDASVKLNFPNDMGKSSALLPMSEEVFKKLASGEITPEQANNLMNILKVHSANMLVIDLAKDIAEMKQKFENKEIK